MFHAIEERSRISSAQNLAIGSSGQTAFLRPLFVIDAAKEGDTFVIRIKGELDLFECPRLERALREAEARHSLRMLLDLEELTFIDAAGLGVLVAALHRSATDSNGLQVTHGKGSVADMFRLTALDTVLPFVPPAQSEQTSPHVAANALMPVGSRWDRPQIHDPAKAAGGGNS